MTRPGAGHVPDKTSGLTLAGAFARSSLALGAVLASVALAHATAWMSEQDLRGEFIGKAFEGYYYDGSEWWSAFAADGQYSLREKGLSAQGVWYFRGRVFCGLFGPPPWVLDEHCALVTRLSANCYEFHTVWPDESPRGRPRPGPSWHSRGWRLGEPSTCADRPIS